MDYLVWLCFWRRVAAPSRILGEDTSAAEGEPSIHLVTLDPGHFHAALVQKLMYPQISPVVHVYAPAGFELDAHLKLIEGFNSSEENPTS